MFFATIMFFGDTVSETMVYSDSIIGINEKIQYVKGRITGLGFHFLASTIEEIYGNLSEDDALDFIEKKKVQLH